MTRSASILVCDDEELIRWSLCEHLRSEGFLVHEAVDGLDCLEAIEREAPDLVLMDLKMPRMGGMEALRQLREGDRELPVVVLTAHGAVDTAVEATRLGAQAYLSKPFDLREVTLELERVLDEHRLATEVRYLRGQRPAAYGRIIGESAALRRLFDSLRRLETVDAPTVLLCGESGTGKDLIANAIHEKGPRKDGPLMEIDCTSLPEQLIESELFGHERGAFTDARTTRRGLFEMARGGTVFLDEIGEMSARTQARLLRALENRKIRRVGGSASIPIDVGIIAATNRDLAVEVAEGRFREDLFFRLNVIRLEVPPLRERRDDLPALIDHFLALFNRRLGRTVQGISGEALACMQAYRWPGNVRELRNVIERVMILEATDRVEAEHLPAEIRHGASATVSAAFPLPEEGIDLEAVERSFLEQAMSRTDGNQSAAARLLGISRYTLRYRLEKYELTA